MRIWWCREHETAALKGSASYCACKHYLPQGYPTPCRMVPMRLIAEDALVFDEQIADKAFRLLDGQMDSWSGMAEYFARAIYQVNRDDA